MSDSYGTTGYGATGAGVGTGESSGTVDTAKHEATEVKDTAKNEAGKVAETAKTEAKSVASEAKTQAKDLYRQSTRELKDQAATQQDRVAQGLRSVGDELRSMAGGADNQGVAADLVQQVSQRVTSAASWLGDRDPGSLLNEVKSYARRKPGTFIAVAALAGLAAGRLTRALAEAAKDHHDDTVDTTSTVGAASLHDTDALDVPATPTPDRFGVASGTIGYDDVTSDAAVDALDGTPVYDESRASRRTGGTATGSGDVRPDSF